jgi:hypothetical protein
MGLRVGRLWNCSIAERSSHIAHDGIAEFCRLIPILLNILSIVSSIRPVRITYHDDTFLFIYRKHVAQTTREDYTTESFEPGTGLAHRKDHVNAEQWLGLELFQRRICMERANVSQGIAVDGHYT